MSNTANQKRRRAEKTREFLDTLVERYSQCFTADRKAVRPLAIGIQEQLKKDLANHSDLAETPNWLIKQALARYTHSPAYLEAIIAGRDRVALDGSDAGPVTDTAKAHAKERRDEQKKRAAEKKRQRKPGGAKPSSAEVNQRKLQRLAEKFNDH
ncbi:MAG: ProQ/FinO family protein [Ectothiorhodospiraceae bacterium]|jgi:ProP effector